jgi:hypothetical protein
MSRGLGALLRSATAIDSIRPTAGHLGYGDLIFGHMEPLYIMRTGGYLSYPHTRIYARLRAYCEGVELPY